MQNVRKSGSLTMPLDYGRWDRLPEDSDDDQLALTVESAPRLAESHPRAAEHLLERQRAYMTFLRWLREVAPELTESETTHLARFVAVQDRATCPEQRERHDAIAAFLGKALSQPEWTQITGKTPRSERTGLLDHFQTHPACRFALLALTACGVGLNLSCADTAVFSELCWNPATLEQAAP